MKDIFGVPRSSLLSHLNRFRDKPVVKVLTGLRRCGKSTALKQFSKKLLETGVRSDDILFIDKDSLEFDDLTDYKQLARFVKDKFGHRKGGQYLFLDEVQEIDGWEKAVVSFLGEGMIDLYLTGSNAHLLSSELSTRLSGRYVEIPAYPLVFSEFREFLSGNGRSRSVDDDFALFLKYGGLPGLHRMDFSDESIYQYLNAVFNTILLKDVVARYAIRDPGQLERVARFTFDNCGNITSARKIAEYLKNQHSKITVDTVVNYLSYMTSAFLLRKVRRFDIKGKRHLELYEKYYMGDIGLRHAFLGFREEDISGLLENVVLSELLFRGYEVSIGKQGEHEIDFIAQRQDRRILIQVAYLLADQKTVEREFKPFRSLSDQSQKVVLSMDSHWGREKDGVLRVYLPDFLLGKEPLLA